MAVEREDGTVVISVVTTGAELAHFSLPSSVEGLRSTLEFAADDSRVYAVSEGIEEADGRMDVWDIRPDTWVATACRTADDQLSDDQLFALTRIHQLDVSSCAYRP